MEKRQKDLYCVSIKKEKEANEVYYKKIYKCQAMSAKYHVSIYAFMPFNTRV